MLYLLNKRLEEPTAPPPPPFNRSSTNAAAAAEEYDGSSGAIEEAAHAATTDTHASSEASDSGTVAADTEAGTEAEEVINHEPMGEEKTVDADAATIASADCNGFSAKAGHEDNTQRCLPADSGSVAAGTDTEVINQIGEERSVDAAAAAAAVTKVAQENSTYRHVSSEK